jgi:type III restriction enzyme
LPSGRELVSYIVREVMKRARLTCEFNNLYPIVERYILEKCFETRIKDIENEKLRKNLNDISIQDAIIDILARVTGEISIETKTEVVKLDSFKLSSIPPFTWRRKHLRCKKTVFNFVAVYNDFEAKFARFLDEADDIERFSALADKFSIDYLSSRGAIRLYYPDFIAVQKIGKKKVFWIIETKGREYEDTDRKDDAIKRWCEDITKQTGQEWKYLKVMQADFEASRNLKNFAGLVSERTG